MTKSILLGTAIAIAALSIGCGLEEEPIASSQQAVSLPSGWVLNPNEAVWDNGYQFVYQGDGNLVLYNGGTPLWHSGTWGTSPGFTAMQGDGNLVVYNSSGAPVWDSHTWGNPGAYADVSSGGLRIHRPSGYLLWGSNWWTGWMPPECHTYTEETILSGGGYWGCYWSTTYAMHGCDNYGNPYTPAMCSISSTCGWACGQSCDPFYQDCEINF
jgi:hypothetical protein